MKLSNINKEAIKKAGRKLAGVLTMISVLSLPISLTGCGGKKADETSNEEQSTEAEVIIENNEEVANENSEMKTEQPPSNSESENWWNDFVKENWNDISSKINNDNKDEFDAALKVFNIEYLNENDKEVLLNYYSKGIDVESELNKAYNILSQMREYNIHADEIYPTSSLLVSEKDKVIIETLESYLKEVKNKDTSKERVEEIFNKIKAFSLGKGKIAVVVGEKIVDVAQIDLSKGAIMLSENVMETISVLCQNIISEEQRAELDNSLRNKDDLAAIQAIMIENNALASVNNSNEEVDDDTLNMIKEMRDIVASEVKDMGVTKEEANALFTIANIDYFMDSKASNNVFKKLYEDEQLNINTLFYYAESAVEKIEMYNLTAKDLYDYGHFFIDSKTDIISVRALVECVSNLRSGDTNKVNESVAFIKGYTQYSSKTVISYTEDGSEKKLDKNALNKGGNQVVNWITYYALINNKSIINNDQLVSDLKTLVDGTADGFNPYYDIVLMMTEYCAENNIAVFDYNVGTYKLEK